MEWSGQFVDELATAFVRQRHKYPAIQLNAFIRYELARRGTPSNYGAQLRLVECVRKELKKRADSEKKALLVLMRERQKRNERILSFVGDPADLEDADDAFVREVRQLPWVQRGDHLLEDL